jgi:hypothetical protein
VTDKAPEFENLRAENTRLIALLETHGITWKKPDNPDLVQPTNKVSKVSRLSTDEKIELFMSLFRGRSDVYPIRWESLKTSKIGYSPVCLNEWRVGVCNKPRIKCSNCSNQLFKSLTEVIIFEHCAFEPGL